MEANTAVNALFHFLQHHATKYLENLYPAYHSLLIVCHDWGSIKLVEELVDQFYNYSSKTFAGNKTDLITIPVCYDLSLGNDLGVMAEKLGLPVDEIIRYHAGATYHVFMLGFLPGFPYMGLIDQRIALPRKHKPVPTRKGAVGIAGRQTGIYPANSPGGWHILGYTPLQMFDETKENPALLSPGDEIRFLPIDLETYKTMSGHEL